MLLWVTLLMSQFGQLTLDFSLATIRLKPPKPPAPPLHEYRFCQRDRPGYRHFSSVVGLQTGGLAPGAVEPKSGRDGARRVCAANRREE